MDVQTLARPEAKDGQGGSITLPVAGMTCASCVGRWIRAAIVSKGPMATV